ncbi:MAG TPA: DNA-3-methyladenine glycosylase 2 family protein [Phycisphaerae bacterium]|nr:DNA-3-methyladenine glycosylase 2 family protein [Phycisphaerae bacterium]
MYDNQKKAPARKVDPHAPALRHLRRADARLGALIKSIGPCALAPSSRYYFALCEAIVSQQLAVKAAATIFARFRKLFPRGTPTPPRTLELSDAQFASAGISPQKRGYLRDLARNFVDGEIPVRRLARMSDDEVIAALTRVKGIGEWTAHMFLIFVLGRPDVWPTGDLGIRRALQINYDLAEKPVDGALTAIAEPWRPYRSVAAWYLWQSLGNKPLAD